MIKSNNYEEAINAYTKKTPILLKSILIGLLTGIVVSGYRFILIEAGELSFRIYEEALNHLIWVPLLFILLGACGILVGNLVSKYGMISGSGIPQVKGIIMGYLKNNWFSTLVAKFFGGALATLAGLSLGREGPSIQLGACVAEGVGEKLALSRTEQKVLIASGASAGLAAAFNAPLSGAMFAMEEIFKYISPVILLSTLLAAVVADFISKIFFGLSPVFQFGVLSIIPLQEYWLLFVLGAVLGAAGAFYNYLLISTQRFYKKVKWLSLKTRLVVPFILAGIIGLTFPIALGSGHLIIEELNLSTSLTFLIILFVVKFVFSMLSFGSGAPGGIFFPLLMLGAVIGGIFGHLVINYIGYDSSLFTSFIVLAMAGYFTAIVRAPITGILLLVEMTGSFTHLLPLTVVSITSYVVADLLKSVPIYESLLSNLIRDRKAGKDEQEKSDKVIVEVLVHHGSLAEKKYLKDIDFPKNCLLIAIKRAKQDIIPRGDTMILAGDYLQFLTNVVDEARIREILTEITSCELKIFS